MEQGSLRTRILEACSLAGSPLRILGSRKLAWDQPSREVCGPSTPVSGVCIQSLGLGPPLLWHSALAHVSRPSSQHGHASAEMFSSAEGLSNAVLSEWEGLMLGGTWRKQM